ncbi:Mitochondrial import inner membrane translocase subunit tim8 [Aspergillus nanangensis]|uniref:Mitochondrial import inner membrane translocase subunit n=1 Tax=Aspergillus nanangensis TaxID=2582783 RepID=A0AAD4CBQ5_ASPNN|nr:Mitochondrial import inner membrane translocase subunit tim8 [Aspergillus nanangensis]
MDQQLDVSKLSEADKKELNQFLTNEAQKSAIQQIDGIAILFREIFSLPGDVHHLADVCWKKCVTGSISSGRLNSSEEACAQNCVERWMDTNVSVLKHLETLRGQ